MTEYMHLVGTEQMNQAAQSMQTAADSMRQTLGWFTESQQRHEQWMDEWLMRYEEILKRERRTHE